MSQLQNLQVELPEEMNAVILLYNFAYHGNVKQAVRDSLTFTYIGCVPYE